MAKKTSQQLYEEQEAALIGDAIAETEQEIFDEALGNDPDENTGDRSLEEMDDEDVLDDDDIEGEAEEGEEGEAEGEESGTEGAEEPPETRHEPVDRRDAARVPPARLREEADARRVAEAENRELRARIEALERGQRQPSREQRQDGQDRESGPPDLFADPEGRLQWERQQIAQGFEERRINASFDDARAQHGDAFVEAFQNLQRTQSPELVRAIVGSNNPGRALMSWHERQALQAEIGDDPAAYRQRVRDELLQDPEVRRAVITGARSDAMRGDGGQPRTQTRLPPSLNGATGGTSHRGDIAPRGRGGASRSTKSIEQEIADSVWDD